MKKNVHIQEWIQQSAYFPPYLSVDKENYRVTLDRVPEEGEVQTPGANPDGSRVLQPPDLRPVENTIMIRGMRKRVPFLFQSNLRIRLMSIVVLYPDTKSISSTRPPYASTVARSGSGLSA